MAFTTLLALAGVAFLPARWFPIPEWRSALEALGVRLPDTISPQPWLTLGSALLLLLELSWAYYLFAADWSSAARQKAWVLTATGITILAGTLTVSFILQRPIPFWPHAEEFGVFVNRNHTSNVLGLGGILVYALALRGFREGRKAWWAWIAALSLICWALILNYSRAGIILLIGGALVWHFYWLISEQEKRRPLIAGTAAKPR